MPTIRYKFAIRITKNWAGTITEITGTIDAAPYPPKPRLLTLSITEEIDQMFYAKINLPPPSASDVATQELTIQVGEEVPLTSNYAADVTVSSEFACGEAGTVVKATLVVVDAAGNRSEPREQLFTVTDTIAPAQPGELTLEVTRQE